MAKYNDNRYTDFDGVNLTLGTLRFGAQRTAALSASDDLGLYWRSDTLYAWDGSQEIDITSGASGSVPSWDAIYDKDKTLTIDEDTFTMSLTHATNDGLTVTGSAGSSGDCIQITNAGSGYDIEGTSGTWFVTKAGSITATALVMADDEAITLGDSSDAVIQWVGASSHLDIAGATNFDGNMTLEAAHSLTIAGAGGATKLTITAGDMVMSDGSLSLTDADNAESVTVINNTATTIGAATSAGIVELESTSLTTGALLNLQLTEATLNGGSYLRAWDATAGSAVFTVGEDGLLTIAGSAAGTNALVMTVGDIYLSDSDGSIIESEDGTGTLLSLDNKAGVIASDSAVLLVDAGGAVASGGNLLRVAPTGSPNAGAIGIEYVGASKAMTAMYIDGDPTASDVVTINGGGALTSDNAVLTVSSDGALATGGNTFRVDTTGTPASGAIYAEFDFAGITDTNENIGVKIDAGGKKVIGLHVDADPEANSAVYFTSGAALAADKATLEVVSNVAACNADSQVIRIQQASATGANVVLGLLQADVSEPFVLFESTEGSGNSVDETQTTEGTAIGFLRISVNGTDRYLSYFGAPSA